MKIQARGYSVFNLADELVGTVLARNGLSAKNQAKLMHGSLVTVKPTKSTYVKTPKSKCVKGVKPAVKVAAFVGPVQPEVFGPGQKAAFTKFLIALCDSDAETA